MKKLLTILTALMLLVLPVLATAQTATDTTYADPDGRFTFAYPSDWVLISKATADAVSAQATSDNNATLSLIIETFTSQMAEQDTVHMVSSDCFASLNLTVIPADGITDVNTLLEAATTFTDRLSASLVDFKLEGDPAVDTYGNYQAFEIYYTNTVNGQTYNGAQLFIINGTNIYLFTYSAPSETEVPYIDAFGGVIATLAFPS